MDTDSTTGGLSCRILLNKDDIASLFQVPSQLVKDLGEDFPKEASLRIDESGKCWKVLVEKLNDQYYITQGWKEFAQDVDIKSWEYMLLNSEFDFSPDETDDGHSELNSGEDKDTVTNPEEAPCVGKKWSFTKELNLNNAYRLSLPKKFATETGIARAKTLTLMDANGRLWPVCVADSCGHIMMGSGWNAFLKANKVSIGSTILFNFISCSSMTIEAQVVKDGADDNALFNFVKWKDGKCEVVASRKISQGTNKKALLNSMQRKCKTRRYEEPTNSSFKQTSKSRELGGGLSFTKKLKEHHLYMMEIPNDFTISTGLTRGKQIILKDAEGREWPVRATARNSGRFAFTAGWHTFLVGSKVVVGSSMCFEFTSDDTVEVRVVEVGKDKKALFSYVKRTGNKFQVSTAHNRSDYARMITNCSPNDDCVNFTLSFSMELKKRHLYELGIPENFTRKTGIAKRREVQLQNGDGRKWKVRVTKRNGRVYWSRGWGDFLKENSVVIGSTMSFVWSSEITIETHIVKEGPNRQALFKLLRWKGKELEIISENRADHVNVHEDSILNVKSVNEEISPEEEYDLGVGRNWRYSKELKKHNAYKLDLPRDLREVIGKESIEEIILQDGKGRKWPVNVRHGKCGVYTITTGWIDFLVGNKVCVGSTILFEFIPSSRNVIEARVLDCGKMGSVLFAKRPKGRPSCPPKHDEVLATCL